MHASDTFWQDARFFVYDLLRSMMPVEHEDFHRIVTCRHVFETNKASSSIVFEIIAGEYKNAAGMYLLYLTDMASGMRHKITIDKTRMRKTVADVENFFMHHYALNFIILGFCGMNELLEVRYKHGPSMLYPIDARTTIEIPACVMMMGSGFLEHAARNPFFANVREIKRFVDVCNVRLDSESLCITEVARNIFHHSKSQPHAVRDYLVDLFQKKNVNMDLVKREIAGFMRDVAYIYRETEHVKIMTNVGPESIKRWVYYDGLQ